MLTDALAGISNALSGEAGTEGMVNGEPKTLHYVFISQILPLTIKVQKEMRGRKCREVQKKLQDAVSELKAFKEEEWPPRQPPNPPEWMEDKQPSPAKSESVVRVAPEDEPVHPAVTTALEAYMDVLTHSARTTRACEWALECISILVSNHYVSGRAGGRDDKTGSGSEAAQMAEEHGIPLPPPSFLHRLVETISKCADSNVETIQNALVKTMRAIMTSPNCGVHEASMLLAVRSTFHVYLVSKSSKESSKMALLDMLRSVFNRMEAYDAMNRHQESELARTRRDSEEDMDTIMTSETTEDAATYESPQHYPSHSFASQFHTDAYVLFRTLCKLSSKELPEELEQATVAASFSDRVSSFAADKGVFFSQPNLDPLAMNNKMLSLELILAVMEFCGEAFCNGEKFIFLVQNHLCVSLLKNCMSNHTQVAFLSQKIFLIVVYKFKAHMKAEIEVFMSNIFLRVLESENSSFKQKALVLESLRSLCSDPVLLTQVFLNYDCDFDAMNLYKDIVHILTKMGIQATEPSSATSNKKDAEESFELSLAGVEVLVTILKAFLKALGLPGGEDSTDDSAGAKIRGALQLDVGLAARPEREEEDNSERDRDARSVRSGLTKEESGRNVAGEIVDAFELKRNAEQNFEKGMVKFTLSLKGGLLFFIDYGFVELDARQMALFFLNNKDKLDKTQMGECLGKEPDAALVKGEEDPEKGGPGFYVRLLHHYASEIDFTGLLFDDAIRLFLSGFRLPGEAQKIDRIMEKFAERYTRQNLDVFPNADTAFILAFSVIMLQTDLHNPSIKPEKRMTVESFIRNNRGISENGGDLPEEFLIGIFNRIKAKPFSLKEDEAAREKAEQKESFLDTTFFFDGPLFGASSEERKREKFKKEKEDMMAATEQLIRRRPGKNTKVATGSSTNLANTVAPADVVMPMFDVTWGPLIGTLSQVLERSNDERSIAVCLNGFVYAVRLASHSNMSLAREAFVSSLAKFTYLMSFKEMKQRNIESIRTLLSIAVMDGEYLGESWGPVLQCISQIARLRLSASGLDPDESFLGVKNAARTPKGSRAASNEMIADGGGLFRQPSRAETEREAEENNGKAVLAAVNEVLIDKVFSSTVHLSPRSLAHFIEQLVAVSKSEIAGSSKRLSTFSVQRLVEVADYNMDVRSRLVWSQVWEKMADYFAEIGCHSNSMVSIFAIDALRQLSSKFLEKPELSEFNFQMTFLRPYLHIMEDKAAGEDIRELVLQCTDNLIQAKSHNIRSGWKVFFAILTRAAKDPSEKINFLGLGILQRLLDEHLHQLCRLSDGDENEGEGTDPDEMTALERRNRNSNVEDFIGLCRASLTFLLREEHESPLPVGLSLRSLCHTAIYADLLADHRVQPPVSGAQWTDPDSPGYTYEGLSEEEALEMVPWRPLLEGLSRTMRSTARSTDGGVGCLVQRGSVLALRSILLRHGHLFSVPQWVVILEQTIIPSIQEAAQRDHSPVIQITSESPSVSSLDFLAESLPPPPPENDEGLQKFETFSRSAEKAPSRPMGSAELLLEASFTDMRHGGDGNLGKAYLFAQKDMHTQANEQPFLDSWVATTAPLALGLLTDIACECMLGYGAEGRQKLWPIFARQIQLWILGPSSSESSDAIASSYIQTNESSWWPCEALVRISCKEVHKFCHRLNELIQQLGRKEAALWNSKLCELFSSTISKNVNAEAVIQHALLETKLLSYEESKAKTEVIDADVEIIVYTPYGKGLLIQRRTDLHRNGVGADDDTEVTMNVISLNFGAILYRPAPGSVKRVPTESRKETDVSERGQSVNWLDHVIPLKIRVVAAYCLQQALVDMLPRLVLLAEKKDISSLQTSLNRSSRTAALAGRDKHLSHAFKQAFFNEWGDSVDDVEALSDSGKLAHLQGSAMFYLAQEAGAMQALIGMLSLLFQVQRGTGLEDSWDKEKYSETFLVEAMLEVLRKFLDSEEHDGHLVDPNVWRKASSGGSGGKIAVYCVSFASVVVGILETMLSFRPDQFARHKQDFFPIICSLIRVQSEEIRQLVQLILVHQFAPLLGVTKEDRPANGET